MNKHNERLKARAEKRRAKFKLLKASGWRLQDIADEYKISKERVRQVLAGAKE